MSRMKLSEIADALDKAQRQGKIPDTPEGSGYILISDTLAKQISADLREIDSDNENNARRLS